MRRVLAAVFLLCTAAGCARDPTRRAQEEALEAQQRVPLVPVTLTTLEAPRPRLRVLVGPTSIDVDDVALFASWPTKRRERLLATLPQEEAALLPFTHRGIARIDHGKLALADTPASGQLEMRALAPVLAYARELERTYEKLARDDDELPPTPPVADVYIAADTRYETAVAVLYTLGQAEYEPAIIARGPNGDVTLPIVLPRIGGHPRVVQVRQVDGGLSLTVTAGMARMRADLPDLLSYSPGTNKPRKELRPILAADRACPSVPDREGAPDLARFEALLVAIGKRIPGERGEHAVLLSPRSEAPWSVVAGLSAIASSAGFSSAYLGVERGTEPSVECQQGIVVDDLSIPALPPLE